MDLWDSEVLPILTNMQGYYVLPVVTYTGLSSVESCQLVAGDRNAWKLLDCLGHMAVLYGERVVLSQFFPCIQDMVILIHRFENPHGSKASLPLLYLVIFASSLIVFIRADIICEKNA